MSTIEKFLATRKDDARDEGGAWEAKLDEDTREVLELFEEWMADPATLSSKGTAFSPVTVKAYRAYVAEYLVRAVENGDPWEKFNTDIRSGVRAFNRFLASVKPVEAPAEPAVEDDDQVIDLG